MKTLKILLAALLLISLSAAVVMASDAINEAEATFLIEKYLQHYMDNSIPESDRFSGWRI